jgi:hypothetical protein
MVKAGIFDVNKGGGDQPQLFSAASSSDRLPAPAPPINKIGLHMDIEIVMRNLYASEINCFISSFWDNHWDVKLGDEMNGFVAEGNFQTLDECADFLDRKARKHFPESSYALGKAEHLRREVTRLKAEEDKWK